MIEKSMWRWIVNQGKNRRNNLNKLRSYCTSGGRHSDQSSSQNLPQRIKIQARSNKHLNPAWGGMWKCECKPRLAIIYSSKLHLLIANCSTCYFPILEGFNFLFPVFPVSVFILILILWRLSASNQNLAPPIMNNSIPYLMNKNNIISHSNFILYSSL